MKFCEYCKKIAEECPFCEVKLCTEHDREENHAFSCVAFDVDVD
jgi:predicted nucleic acid binding AN1-type Zn finger protein